MIGMLGPAFRGCRQTSAKPGVWSLLSVGVFIEGAVDD